LKRLLLIVSIILSTTILTQGQQSRSIPGPGPQVSYIRLYPNPATTIVNFDFQKGYDRGYSIQVFNLLGKVMYEQQNLPERASINLSQFSRGVYIYYLRDRSSQLLESGKFQVVK